MSQLFNGTVTGYNSSGNNIIIKDIVMNDPRNNTLYRCVINDAYGDLIFLHVAGEYISICLCTLARCCGCLLIWLLVCYIHKKNLK